MYSVYADGVCIYNDAFALDNMKLASPKLTLEDKLQVLSVWQEMQMNAFNSVPIVLAEDVSWAAVIRIETRLIALDGISVAVENQRVYPKGTLACHVLGYTGKMQSENQIRKYVAKGYKRSDVIGLDGVEASMEDWLTPNSSARRASGFPASSRTMAKPRLSTDSGLAACRRFQSPSRRCDSKRTRVSGEARSRRARASADSPLGAMQ